MLSHPIYLPFCKIMLIARWYYIAMLHFLAISPHFPRYTLATNDYNNLLFTSQRITPEIFPML